MPSKRKKFSCGHRGFGAYCHRCQHARKGILVLLTNAMEEHKELKKIHGSANVSGMKLIDSRKHINRLLHHCNYKKHIRLNGGSDGALAKGLASSSLNKIYATAAAIAELERDRLLPLFSET